MQLLLKTSQKSRINLITEPQSRNAILRAKSKCFIYLRGNHRMNECQSKLICFRCKQMHHVSIYEQDDRNTQNSSNDINDANKNMTLVN